MPCYCREIRQAEQELSWLGSVLTKIDQLLIQLSLQKTTQRNTKDCVEYMVAPDNISSLEELTGNERKVISADAKALFDLLKREKGLLGIRYNVMKSSDRSYHRTEMDLADYTEGTD